MMVEKAIWLDITLLYLYFHSPTAHENTGAHSCNIQPYRLFTKRFFLLRDITRSMYVRIKSLLRILSGCCARANNTHVTRKVKACLAIHNQ